MSSAGKGRKRVRFSDQPQIREFEPSQIHDEESPELQELEGGINAVHLDTMDPTTAAYERAKRRKEVLMLSFERMDGFGDGVDGAEAEYDEVPASSRLEHAARLEPFHMKREREVGYFDSETGDYVEYATRREEPDAWADSLPVLETLGEDDSDSDGEHSMEMAVEDGPDVAMLRQTILAALREGETVLGALRRIGRERVEVSAPAPSALRRAAMAPAAAAAFEALTDAAAGLMRAASDFGLYSKTREQIAGRGVWVNSVLGCTFDPATQLYGDVGSGAWYRWQDGQYHPVVSSPS